METTELINLVAQFSFGRYKITERDSNLFLQYLNIADNDLFQCVKNSHRLRQKIDVFFDDDKNYVDLPTNYILQVGTDNVELFTTGNIYSFNNKNNYYYLDNKIYVDKSLLKTKIDPLDNALKSYITFLIRPNRKILVKAIANPNEIIIPIYPEDHHIALIFGAVYYLFQSYKGYASKIQIAKFNWDNAKTKLTQHYEQEKA
jgi:hypothetical protein